MPSIAAIEQCRCGIRDAVQQELNRHLGRALRVCRNLGASRLRRQERGHGLPGHFRAMGTPAVRNIIELCPVTIKDEPPTREVSNEVTGN